MKAVDQTKFGKPDGNCFAACVATIFEIPLEDVPHTMHLDDWFQPFRKWCVRVLRCEPLCFGATADAEWLLQMQAPVIVSGPAERGLDHATVWLAGKMVHDPHPSRAGLLRVSDAIVFIPLAPERLLAAGAP